jgi:Holliday junction resolvase RusA-like endonuclease
MYTPGKTKDAEQTIQDEARASMRGRPIIAGPVAVTIEMHHSIRPSWPKAKRDGARLGRIVPTIKVDVDNCMKLYFDAFNGVVWVDDVQVIMVTAEKRFSDEPCVLITVTEIDKESA